MDRGKRQINDIFGLSDKDRIERRRPRPEWWIHTGPGGPMLSTKETRQSTHYMSVKHLRDLDRHPHVAQLIIEGAHAQ